MLFWEIGSWSSGVKKVSQTLGPLLAIRSRRRAQPLFAEVFPERLLQNYIFFCLESKLYYSNVVLIILYHYFFTCLHSKLVLELLCVHNVQGSHTCADVHHVSPHPPENSQHLDRGNWCLSIFVCLALSTEPSSWQLFTVYQLLNKEKNGLLSSHVAFCSTDYILVVGFSNLRIQLQKFTCTVTIGQSHN